MSDLEIERLYKKYFACVYSVCMLYMKNEADACDMVQETFIKLCACKEHFSGDDHVKAWLITVASNACKSELRKWWRKHTTEYVPEQHGEILEQEDNLLRDMMENLKETYRIPLYLYYFEGYRSREIAKLLNISASAVRSRIEKGRKLLKEGLVNGYGQDDEKNAVRNSAV